MTEQIRSADLLVKTILSNSETMDALKNKPEETLRSVALESTQSLPQLILEPSQTTSNIIWLIVISSFVLVMLWAAIVLGRGVDAKLEAGAIYVTKGETMLTVFTTVVAFLAGLLSPSPVKK